MQIMFNHTEIQTALRNMVESMGISTSGKTVDISLTAGRGGNGYSATVDITEGSVVVEVSETKTEAVVETATPEVEETTPVEEEQSDAVEPASLFGSVQ